jgi:antitoxin FitA
MAALSIRDLDESVKRRLQYRAARHDRSMEAEVREILTEAVREPADPAGLFTAILERLSTTRRLPVAANGPGSRSAGSTRSSLRSAGRAMPH